MFLVLDSSADHFRIVVSRGEQTVLDLSYESGGSKARRLFSSLSEVLSEKGISISYLDWIACGLGPGNFISTRYAVSLAHGFSTAIDVPITGFNSLLARALSGRDLEHPVLVFTRAKQDQLRALLLADGHEIELLRVPHARTGEEATGYLIDIPRLPDVVSAVRERFGAPHVVTGEEGLLTEGDGRTLVRGVEVQETVPTPGLLAAARHSFEEQGGERKMRQPLEPIYLRPAVESR